jgi:hypothetical protein
MMHKTSKAHHELLREPSVTGPVAMNMTSIPHRNFQNMSSHGEANLAMQPTT